MPAPNELAHLLDFCDTLDVVCTTTPDRSRPYSAIVDMMDQVRDLPREATGLATINRYSSDVLRRADAFINSPAVNHQHPGFQQVLPTLFDQRVSVSKNLAGRDLALWQHTVQQISETRELSPLNRYRMSAMLLEDSAMDKEQQCYQALGVLKLHLVDLTLGQLSAPPTPDELFDAEHVRITHTLPEKEGDPVVSTLTYAGDVITQVSNPAIRHPTGCLVPPVNNLSLARRLRTLFYHGEAAQGIEARFHSQDHLIADIEACLHQAKDKPYVDSAQLDRLTHHFAHVASLLQPAAAPTPTSTPQMAC